VAFWFKVKPSCFDKAAIVSSKFKVLNPDKSNSLVTDPLPAPGEPAKIIAFGLPCISFKSDISPIMDMVCYKYNKKGLDN
jgi:hypothetical protein